MPLRDAAADAAASRRRHYADTRFTLMPLFDAAATFIFFAYAAAAENTYVVTAEYTNNVLYADISLFHAAMMPRCQPLRHADYAFADHFFLLMPLFAMIFR